MRRERFPNGWRSDALSCMGAPLVGDAPMIRQAVQNPPPPPAVPGGAPTPPVPPRQHAMTTHGSLAGPGLRIVGGLIGVGILLGLFGGARALFRGGHVGAGIVDLCGGAGYFGY